MHVDNLLKQLQLGFSLRDVMSDLVLELRTNLDLRNACERKDYVLSQHLGMRVNLKVRWFTIWTKSWGVGHNVISGFTRLHLYYPICEAGHFQLTHL